MAFPIVGTPGAVGVFNTASDRVLVSLSPFTSVAVTV